ncbi:MAG: hypothetical protein ACE5KZ_03710 [Candidatus Scalinduaceae bacterium]
MTRVEGLAQPGPLPILFWRRGFNPVKFRERISDSGGTIVFFAPGLSSQITHNLSSTFSVQIPILQNLGRDHQDIDLKVLFGIGYSF